MTHHTFPRLYSDLASWWPLLSPVADYRDEARELARLLDAQAARPVRTLLELGSGGGNNAHFLREHYDLTLVDVSDEMLGVSRALNPDCEHVCGDMRTVRLERGFDAVLIHDAIAYMTTDDDLRAAITTCAEHLSPGGVVLLAPDHTRESFVPGTDSGGVDGDGRALRYLDWTWDPDPSDTTIVVDFAYLLREGDVPPRCVSDRHVVGLFAEAAWRAAIEAAGLRARREGRFFIGLG